jgi:DNA polymerase-3 subunit gamma/tau
VPVTILSRCQRFDLRRVEPDMIIANLQAIAANEGATFEPEALTLIARAAEGSVRDAQSMLDQAIVQAEPGEPVSATAVRDMLGLADRAQTIDLFEKAVRGEAAPALEAFRSLFAFGADPATVMLDLMDHCHGASVAKALGPDVLTLPKDQAQRLAALGAALSAGSLSRLWQMLLKAYDEVRRAPDPAAAVEMALIRLAYAADLPPPEEALRALAAGEALPTPPPHSGAPAPSGNGGAATAVARAPAPAPAPTVKAETAPTLQTFEDVVALIDSKRDIGLKLDVERYVRLVSYRPGVIEFEPAPGAPANLAPRLVARLKDWTGAPWLVAAEGGGGAETLLERQTREQGLARKEALAEPFVQAVMQAFPGAELVEVRHVAAPETAPADDADEDDDEE